MLLLGATIRWGSWPHGQFVSIFGRWFPSRRLWEPWGLFGRCPSTSCAAVLWVLGIGPHTLPITLFLSAPSICPAHQSLLAGQYPLVGEALGVLCSSLSSTCPFLHPWLIHIINLRTLRSNLFKDSSSYLVRVRFRLIHWMVLYILIYSARRTTLNLRSFFNLNMHFQLFWISLVFHISLDYLR